MHTSNALVFEREKIECSHQNLLRKDIFATFSIVSPITNQMQWFLSSLWYHKQCNKNTNKNTETRIQNTKYIYNTNTIHCIINQISNAMVFCHLSDTTRRSFAATRVSAWVQTLFQLINLLVQIDLLYRVSFFTGTPQKVKVWKT